MLRTRLLGTSFLLGCFVVFGCGDPSGSKTDASSGGQGGSTAGGTQAAGGSGAGAVGGSANGGSSGGSASGGTQATGGSGGSGPAPVIQACDDVQPESGWQEVTPPGDLGDVSLITLDPLEVGTIYVHMHKGGNGAHSPTDGLYKSTDCGSSWNKLPPGRNARDETEGEVNIHSGSLVSLIADPVEPGVLYTASNYGPSGIYKSTNGGVDWDQMIPDDLLQYASWYNGLSVDPTDRLHLVGANHTGCTGPYAPNCLAETRDGGETWRYIPAPVSGSEQCGAFIYNSTTMLYVSGQNGAFLTTDDEPDNDTPTWTTVAQGANGGDTGLFAYQASDGKYYLGTDYGVLVGSSDFTTWTLDDAAPHQLPFIVGTGENLFASTRSPDIYTAKEDDPSSWSKLEASGTPPDMSGRWLAYDPEHKLFYSSMWGDGGGGAGTPGSGGLFRLPTP